MNDCKVALNLCRYNRHNEILQIISNLVQNEVIDQYQFPSSLVLSDLCPDLISHSNLTKSATIVELTVYYETKYRSNLTKSATIVELTVYYETKY